MELAKHQICRVSSQSKDSNSLKPATKLLASLVLLSVFLSWSSLLLPEIFNLIRSLSYNVGKNYIFLLFNGILVLVTISRRRLGDSDEAVDLHGEQGVTSYEPSSKEKEMELSEIEEVVVVEENVAVEEEEKEIRCIEDNSLVVVGGKNGALITEEVEDEQGNENDSTKESEEEEIGLEEWNKRFDDFIRRMKEGIKIEAQQAKLAVRVGQ